MSLLRRMMRKRTRAALAPRIKVVFFDIGNVLLRFDARQVLRRIAAAVGRHPVRVGQYLWKSDIGERIELGEIDSRELYGLFQEELNYTGDYREFCKLWCDHFTLHRGTAALLKMLTRTHRVYLLSNTNALHYDFIREHYVFPSQVHGAVLSHELHLRKPDARIYKAALRMAGVRAEEALFIDDLAENVEAAQRVGMHAVQFTRLPALVRHMKALGVLDGR